MGHPHKKSRALLAASGVDPTTVAAVLVGATLAVLVLVAGDLGNLLRDLDRRAPAGDAADIFKHLGDAK